MKAIILAAGLGTRLEPVTGGLPKCMVQVGGRPLVDRMIDRLGEAGLDDLVVVTGHRADELREHIGGLDHPLARRAVFVHNDRYADWGNFYSLLVAEQAVGDDGFLKLDADVLLDGQVLPRLLAAEGPAVLAIDRRDAMGAEEMKARVDEHGRVVELNKRIPPERALGEFIGVDRVDAELAPTVFAALRELIEAGETHEYYERAYERLVQRGTHFGIADVTGCLWCEVDDADDLAAAEHLLAGG